MEENLLILFRAYLRRRTSVLSLTVNAIIHLAGKSREGLLSTQRQDAFAMEGGLSIFASIHDAYG